MNPPVYTATGNFNDPNILSLDICIPIEDANNPYEFDSYDMSKLAANNQQINVVFSHVMKINDNGSEWKANNYDFHLDITIPLAKNFPTNNAIQFDTNNADAVYILYHNVEIVTEAELQWFYDKIEEIYENVKNGNYNMTLPFNHSHKNAVLPRKVGISLIMR